MEEVRKKRRRKLSSGIVCIVGVIVSTVFATQVFGGYSYTSVASPPDGEKNHAQILHDIYGGTFTKSGVNYSNGTVSALRAYDFDDMSMHLNLLTQILDGEVDQIWTDGIATVTARAKYASFHQSFGWNGDHGTGTTYHELLTDADIPTQREVELLIGGDFLWGYKPDGYQWWTMHSKNSDSKDHFITYKLNGLEGSAVVWLIFMEDLPLSQADRDYNDFVVEISAIPEPATVFMLIAGAAMLLRKKR